MDTLEVERSNGTVTVTLNRPEKKNAINERMWGELLEVFVDVRDRREDRVLVVTGAGDGFCSGADLSDPGATPRHPLERMRRVGEVAVALYRLPKPTIAKVNGVAAGAGCNLALACDLVVASEAARFSEIFARRGLSIDFGGSWLLPRIIGLQKAKELTYFAAIIDAARAAELGLVNRVVPAEQLDDVVAGWARQLTEGPPLALSMTKSMLNQSFTVTFEQAIDEEGRCQAVNLSSADAAEALAAFLEKRTPRFIGE